MRVHFDDFAESFDAKLNKLEYRAPELVHRAVAVQLGEPMPRLVVADLGCGTGLAGPYLRRYAAELVGVDLSPKMLAKAAERRLYDELTEAELGEFLRQHLARFDLVAAVDTLLYFGDLEPTFHEIASALRPGGHLVFTTEQSPPGVGTYQLMRTGRYCHNIEHLLQLLSCAGFRRVEYTTDVIRTEANEPVVGYVVWADGGSAEPS